MTMARYKIIINIIYICTQLRRWGLAATINSHITESESWASCAYCFQSHIQNGISGINLWPVTSGPHLPLLLCLYFTQLSEVIFVQHVPTTVLIFLVVLVQIQRQVAICLLENWVPLNKCYMVLAQTKLPVVWSFGWVRNDLLDCAL